MPTTLLADGVLETASREVADVLSAALGSGVVVSWRPVDSVVTPAAVITMGEPARTPGGTHCDFFLHLAVVLIAGRFSAQGTWEALLDLEETAWNALEALDGTQLDSTGRVGPVEAGGVDYLACVIDLTLWRNGGTP